MTKKDLQITQQVIKELSTDFKFLNDLCLSHDHSFGLWSTSQRDEMISDFQNFLNLVVKNIPYSKNDEQSDEKETWLVKDPDYRDAFYELDILEITDTKRYAFCEIRHHIDKNKNTKKWIDFFDIQKHFVHKLN